MQSLSSEFIVVVGMINACSVIISLNTSVLYYLLLLVNHIMCINKKAFHVHCPK